MGKDKSACEARDHSQSQGMACRENGFERPWSVSNSCVPSRATSRRQAPSKCDCGTTVPKGGVGSSRYTIMYWLRFGAGVGMSPMYVPASSSPHGEDLDKYNVWTECTYIVIPVNQGAMSSQARIRPTWTHIFAHVYLYLAVVSFVPHSRPPIPIKLGFSMAKLLPDNSCFDILS